MPVRLFRRAGALLMLGLAAAALAACRDQPEGAVRVTVIGDKPSLRDPYLGPLDASQALLAGSVAQGLVRFDAGGNIVGGIAERWNVSDDGLSYIFRIGSIEWSDGRKVTAEQVARAVKRQISRRSKNPLADALGAVEDVVAMTDRVIEIRLRAPRPNLLALLAQPELGIMRSGRGTGPFTILPSEGAATSALRLRHETISPDDEATFRQDVVVDSGPAREAVASFARGDVDLVLGGTFADLPWTRATRLPRGSLRFDPAAGLFGLVPLRTEGPLATVEMRKLLSEAIDRGALIAALNVPGLTARATILEPGLDGAQPAQPAWFAVPLAERRPALLSRARPQGDDEDQPVIRIHLPDGPGAEIVLRRLVMDWGALGFGVERAERISAADFRFLDAVAPSSSPAWFLRNFRCAAVPVCVAEADTLLESARAAAAPAERYALIGQASAQMEEAQLFIPLAAPIRWSLVAPRIQGFAGNRYARHTLLDLAEAAGSGGS